MPRKDIDYSKTIIYKIACNDLTIQDCYVGSTTEFTKRKYKHKYSCNTEGHHTHNYEVYKIIRLNGGWDNWSMIEIEKYSCNDGNEARSRERHWYEILNAKLNTQVPSQSKNQYYQNNKEYFSELSKNRYETNKEKIKISNTLNREAIKERKKKWRELHRDEINQKQRAKRALSQQASEN